MAKELDDQEFRGELNGEGDHLQEEEEVPEPVDGPLGDDRATELAEVTGFGKNLPVDSGFYYRW